MPAAHTPGHAALPDLQHHWVIDQHLPPPLHAILAQQFEPTGLEQGSCQCAGLDKQPGYCARTGDLDGPLQQTRCDTTAMDVRVRTDKTNFGQGADLPIIPGMTASVDIITGKISLYSPIPSLQRHLELSAT